VPELPELDVLAENLAARLGGARVAAVRVVSVAALKTFDPPIDALVGLAVTGFGWGTSLAGTEPFRGYWFNLVWTGFILAADAVVWARAGRSLLHGGGWRLVAMFALSSPFWWIFEVANWRLENWRYVGTTVHGGQAHLVLKTISFLFVLPALAESRDLLRSFVRFPQPPAVPLPPWTATALLVLGLVCVPLLYLFPDQAYPLVWLAPLAVLDAVARLRGRPSIIGLVRRGRDDRGRHRGGRRHRLSVGAEALDV